MHLYNLKRRLLVGVVGFDPNVEELGRGVLLNFLSVLPTRQKPGLSLEALSSL
jgi:hypothetical protein